jgi:hypothetical protein
VINFVRQLIAAPLRVLAWICGFVPIFDRLKLVEIIWTLGREPADAAAVLSLTASGKGMDAARARAEEMFAAHPDAQIAATMGWLQIYHNKDLVAAGVWLKRGSESGVKDPEKLLDLELHICRQSGDDTDELVGQILSRNDLPMETTRKALIIKTYKLLAKEMWTEAGKIAQRMLSIEENADIRLLCWTICLANGQNQKAQKHFARAQRLWFDKKLPESVFNMLVAQGYLMLGKEEIAMDWMYRSERNGVWLCRLKAPIGSFADSKKYKTYCRERENT